jgi:hypothetical protein
MSDRHLQVRPGDAAAAPGRRRPGRSRGLPAALAAALLCGVLAAAGQPASAAAGTATADQTGTEASGQASVSPVPGVFPTLWQDLVAYYDFEHPVRGNPAQERDLGFSGTTLDLVNGGGAMRVRDGAHPGSRSSLQTMQVDPATAGNDDWKAGVWSEAGVPTLHAFNGVKEVTIMGWVKQTGTNPNPDSNTPDPNDFFNAVGLAGILSGTSDGHAVRALLEVINVSGELRVVALGRRVDTGASQTFAANQDWQAILPQGEWVFLAATFDFDDGTMRLYRNGRPLDGFYAVAGDPWAVAGPPEPDLSSASDPRGIKIGGSFPQDTLERNPCNCRMDSLMFLDRAVTDREVLLQYHWATLPHH